MDFTLACFLGLVILAGGVAIGAALALILLWSVGRKSVRGQAGEDPQARMEWLLKEVEKERILQEMSPMFWDKSEAEGDKSHG